MHSFLIINLLLIHYKRFLQGLDFVISEARKYGIRLILSLSNNYHDFGGRPQYVNWARAAGASVNSDDEFYTNAIVKGYYKNHVKVKQKTRNQTKHFGVSLSIGLIYNMKRKVIIYKYMR